MKFAICVLAILVTGGCIEPHLVACGDRSCPTGTSCVADTCATPASLAACDGKADGEGCAIDARVGRCASGVCAISGCGNGVVDPGEVCDDGNLDYGDGCSGDCLSLETCGNGIADFAAGESCDCGRDAATKSPRCHLPNSDDPDAECSLTCQLRYCGDGALDNLEQCDGAALGGAVCSGFGYYRGTPSCSAACQLDLATCEGRCGDGTIDPAFGEFCDGSAPAGSCLDYGYDAGAIACSAACTPALERCERFGWQKIDERPTQSLWASPTQALVVSPVADGTTNAWMVIDGIRELAPAGTFAVAAGDGTAAYAVGATSVAVWSGLAWSTIAVGWTTGVPTAAWASPSLGLYVAVGGAVWRYTSGAWADQGLAGITGVGGDATTAHAWGGGAVMSSTGGAWTAETLPASGVGSIDLFVTSSVGPAWLGSGANVFRRDGATWSQAASSGGAIAGGGTNAVGDLVTVTAAHGVVEFFNQRAGSPYAILGGPGPQYVVVTADGGITMAGTTGTYRIRTGDWFARDQIFQCCAYAPYDGDRFSRLHVTPDDRLILVGAFGQNTGIWSGDLGVTGPEDFVANDAAYLSDGTEVYATDGGIVDNTSTVLVDGDFTVMSIARSGDVLAGGIGIVAIGTASGWQTYDFSGTSVSELGQDDAGNTWAVIDGRSIVTVPIQDTDLLTTTQGVSDLWVAPTGEVVAVGGDTVWVCAAGACTPTVLGGTLYTVSGTSITDIFVGGSQILGASPLAHWNGATWLPVRADSGLVRDLDATTPRLVYVDGSRNVYGLSRIARW